MPKDPVRPSNKRLARSRASRSAAAFLDAMGAKQPLGPEQPVLIIAPDRRRVAIRVSRLVAVATFVFLL